MKVKTAELTGPALDWVVAKCISPLCGMVGIHQDNRDRWHITLHGERGCFAPSTDWAQGGPIFEQAGISPTLDRHRMFDPDEPVERWYATLPTICDTEYTEYGPTLLVAAMRCYVASKLGDEVDVPKELT